MMFSNWISVLLPPIAGAVIGYFTNDIAIKMLFRPYKAIYIGKNPLPFTPGLIPRNQERLAKRVSDTIMGSLLTPEEIQNLAKRLLKTERVQGAILWLLQLTLKQVRDDQEQKTARILAEILRDLFGESLPRLIRVWSRREDFLQKQIDQIFDQVLLDFKLTDQQARQLSDWILESVISPDIMRQAIIDFLTERNIQILDEGFREKTSGTYWVIANLFGVTNTLVRFREFCIDDKDIANARFKDLLLSLEIRNRLREWLKTFSLQSLPTSTVHQLRQTIRETARNYLQDKGVDFFQGLGQSVNWDHVSQVIINRLQNSNTVLSSLEVVSQELALVLERYLEADLEKLVAQAIPILSIDQVIVEKINATSAEDLEIATQSIVQSELQAIVNLGGILGFIVGLMQTLIIIIT